MSVNASVCGIIAAYNAQETIADVVRGVRRYLGTVIVADDGCTDGTADAARQAGAEIIRLDRNCGKGHALRVLFAEARARGFSAAIAVCLAYIPIKGLVEVIAGVLLILSLSWVMFNSMQAQVKKDDTLYDLGSGDGRILVAAAKTIVTRDLPARLTSTLPMK